MYLNTRYPPAVRAAALVSRMTLAEKVAQLHTNSGPAIPRLGVQQYTYWNEAQHGILYVHADINTPPSELNAKCPVLQGSQRCVPATSFPTNFASTMTWDRSLMYQETTAISDKAHGFLDKSL